MVDVLHFIFEEDFTAVSEDHAYSRSGVRETLYKEMYGLPYNFKLKPRKSAGSNATDVQHVDDFDSMTATPVDPRNADPFGSRTETKKEKIKFASAEDMPVLIETSFDGLDAPLN